MPRISPVAIRQAHHISPYAAQLLPVCRDLQSALNEARWIREHVEERRGRDHEIAQLCRRRARGEPLQYVLGTQPFGNLDMKCRPGVLIPRPEPEAYTIHLANLILQSPSVLGGGNDGGNIPPSLRILDLCTGTGCIALLFYSLLQRSIPNLVVHGVDISPHAVQLADENIRHNIRQNAIPPPSAEARNLAFSQGDIFSDALVDSLLSAAAATAVSSSSSSSSPPPTTAADAEQPVQTGATTTTATATSSSTPSWSAWDLLVCNPPYISHRGFARHTARSVRHYEPKLAQVPMVTYPGDHAPEDAFYARLLDVSARLRPRNMLFEVGDLEQAIRVATMALQHLGLRRQTLERTGESKHLLVEIWRDWPDATPGDNEQTLVNMGHHDEEVRIRGSGHGRSVFIQC